MRLKALLESKGKMAAEIRKMADVVNGANDGKGRDFTAEERTAWDKLNADYDSNERLLEIERRAAEVGAAVKERYDFDADSRRPATRVAKNSAERARDVRKLAFEAWLCPTKATPERLAAAQEIGINILSNELDVEILDTADHIDLTARFHNAPAADRRHLRIGATDTTLSTATNAGGDGGFLIPPGELLRRLEINMLTFGNVEREAENIRTATGEPILWPTGDDTTNVGEQLAEEADATSTNASLAPTISQLSWGAYMYSSKPVKVSNQLLEDSAFDVPAILGDMLGERLARILNKRFTTGTGSGQPQGIVTAATLGVTCASASAIAADELLDLEHSVDPAYRVGAKWMLHDSTKKLIRKLKASTGEYLWRAGGLDAGITGGSPDTLSAYQVVTNNDMATVTNSAKVMLFGQFFKYKVRTVRQVRLVRLNELYALTNQVGFIAFIRKDGKLLTAGTSPVNYMAMHS